MTHPYRNLKSYAHWASAVARTPMSEVDPVVGFKFKLSRSDKIATAGSCFAQHIGRHLKSAGFNYLVVEPGHPIASPQVNLNFGYGVFSGRYGNVYTSRQLVQLFDRAYGDFVPAEDVWTGAGGRLFDPFRPTIQRFGFATAAEFQHDRQSHLAAVRRMFETLDVFVFTLGLTEFWASRADGAAFPVCPGVAAGEFDPSRHLFQNLSVDEVVSDMEQFIERLARVNRRAKVILTVSPVPLNATAEDRHVLSATTLSKSVLRVAADRLDRGHDHVSYFPSYEIITGAYSRGQYYGPDLRNVTEDGVLHVMRLFMRHATEDGQVAAAEAPDASPAGDRFVAEMRAVAEAICDEDLIKPGT